MTKTIKLYDGVKIIFKGKEHFYSYISDLWQALKWDIENDDMAKACADEVTRQLIAFGSVEFPNDNGIAIRIELIPAND